jgi:hypothetical protein
VASARHGQVGLLARPSHSKLCRENLSLCPSPCHPFLYHSVPFVDSQVEEVAFRSQRSVQCSLSALGSEPVEQICWAKLSARAPSLLVASLALVEVMAVPTADYAAALLAPASPSSVSQLAALVVGAAAPMAGL